MLDRVKIENYGPLPNLFWKSLGRINLVIGANGAGKTFLLKIIYSAVRTLEIYKRGQEPRAASEILAEKLYWTFQAEKVGDLVTKGGGGSLDCVVGFGGKTFHYGFSRDAAKSVVLLKNSVRSLDSNSIFLPPKEVLSLQSVILRSRDLEQEFGFDDTYYDLAKALGYLPTAGRNYKEFASSRERLEGLLGGRIRFDVKNNRWQFQNKKNQRFQIGVTAEGVKKIAILDTLLGNRYLSPDSIVFIDEPESALHPKAISEFLDIIETLAACGIQFFIASHSYFVIKKLYLIAQRTQQSIPVLSCVDGEWQQEDMKDGMPPNPIIDESIRLYEEEVQGVLG